MHYFSYNERKPRGTIDFPIELYHVDYLHPQYQMSYHWHVETELIYILEGEFTLSLNERESLLKKGDCVLINPGTLHGGIPNHCTYMCIVFDMNMLLKQGEPVYSFIKKIIDGVIIFKSDIIPNYHSLSYIISLLFTIMAEKKEGYQVITLGTLYQLFGFLYQEGLYHSSNDINQKDYKRIKLIKHVLHEIESSYSTPLTLTMLSKIAGMSPKYFCKFFYDMTHKTPIDYLNHYRIERACYELITTDYSITEVAYNCGFNDISYFIKTFKKYKGVTPKRYIHLEISSSSKNP